jgi:hypothetical protein
MSDLLFPKDKEFGKTLSDLLGREVKVKAIATATPLKAGDCFFGGYDDGKGEMEAGWLGDIAACVSLAAALTLVPAGVAKEAVQTKKVSADLQDNFREVVNIAANSFVGKRVRLTEFRGPGEPLMGPWQDWLGKAGRAVHFEVAVTGYIPGRVSLLAAAAAPAGP